MIPDRRFKVLEVRSWDAPGTVTQVKSEVTMVMLDGKGEPTRLKLVAKGFHHPEEKAGQIMKVSIE